MKQSLRRGHGGQHRRLPAAAGLAEDCDVRADRRRTPRCCRAPIRAPAPDRASPRCSRRRGTDSRTRSGDGSPSPPPRHACAPARGHRKARRRQSPCGIRRRENTPSPAASLPRPTAGVHTLRRRQSSLMGPLPVSASPISGTISRTGCGARGPSSTSLTNTSPRFWFHGRQETPRPRSGRAVRDALERGGHCRRATPRAVYRCWSRLRAGGRRAHGARRQRRTAPRQERSPMHHRSILIAPPAARHRCIDLRRSGAIT